MSSSTLERSQTIKVPEVTVYFWIAKILTTGAGESASDFLAHRFNPIIAAAAGALGFVVALWIQFKTPRYSAWAYWFAVLMVAIFGTMAADVLHDGLHVSYLVSTAALAVGLAIMFTVWYRREGTLSIHSIDNRRREAFYWTTVVATFAVGTAAGDMTATTFGWGYLLSGVMFGVAIAIVGIANAIAARMSGQAGLRDTTRGVIAFWIAYVLTRPLGASFADWMGKPVDRDGLGWGDGTVAVVLIVVIAIVVGYLARSRVDVPRATAPVPLRAIET